MKIPKILTNWRVIVALIFLVLAIFAIHPSTQQGAAIRFVEKGSAADFAKMASPEKNSNPLDHEVITKINDKPILSAVDYYDAIAGIEPNRTISIVTDKGRYTVTTLPEIYYEPTGNLVNKTFQETEYFNETINESSFPSSRLVNVTKLVNETIERVIGTKEIGLTVYDAPKTNLKKGLDLAGGVRVILEPEENVSSDVVDRVVEILDRRLNALGLSDVTIRRASNLLGNDFVIVEIAGLQTKEMETRLREQGKFEAKINATTVFSGGGDVLYICRSADCSGIDPSTGCGQTQEGYTCRFFFTVDLSPEAAQRQADATRNLDVITENGEQFLNQKIDFYLDDKLVDSLNIGAGLKGRAETKIQISGSGSGTTRQDAVNDALSNMKNLQAILQTGSLPVKLKIIKADNLSPTLGDEFLRTSVITGLVALVVISLIIFARYRTLKTSIPTIITNLVEFTIILGASAFIKTNFDLAAIAGIIIVIGTGVNDQIVILDELLRKETVSEGYTSAKGKIKNAFLIILMAFSTNFVAMLPLIWAGAGILRGFAITTIVGALVGILITRPAYAVVIEHIMKKAE